MRIEHFALNVAHPKEMSAWYVKHLDMKIVRKLDSAPYTHFLGDSSGNVMLEIYNNPPNQVPDYPNMNPLLLHLAFVTDDPKVQSGKLIAEGASFVEELNFDDGTQIVMLRDPWGLAIQLCKRGKPMLI